MTGFCAGELFPLNMRSSLFCFPNVCLHHELCYSYHSLTHVCWDVGYHWTAMFFMEAVRATSTRLLARNFLIL